MDDPLNPARGCVNGILAGAGLWLLIITIGLFFMVILQGAPT